MTEIAASSGSYRHDDIERFLEHLEHMTETQWREVYARYTTITKKEWVQLTRMLATASIAMNDALTPDREEFKARLASKKEELKRALDIIGRLPAEMRVEDSPLFHGIRHATSVRIASFRTRPWWKDTPFGPRADEVFRSFFAGFIPGE